MENEFKQVSDTAIICESEGKKITIDKHNGVRVYGTIGNSGAQYPAYLSFKQFDMVANKLKELGWK